MAGLDDLIPDRIQAIPGYRPGRRSVGAASGKLSSNEAPLGPAPAVGPAVAAAMLDAHRYPGQEGVRALLAEHLAVDPGELVLTNGSDELCYLLGAVFLGPGRVVVAADPCYQIDANVSLLAGADLRRIPLVAGGHDLEAMAKAAQDATLVWLPSPHNPTGVPVDPAELELFLDQVPSSCLVVLDEAYRAYLEPDRRPDVGRLIAEHPNLLVQRTFSKDWALAGLRAGYAIGSPRIVAALARVSAPFNVNAAALAAIEAAMGAPGWHAMAVDRVQAERRRLEEELTALGVEFYPSSANFVTVHLDHADVGQAFAAAGLSVRPGEDLGLPGWIRISVGWAPQMAVCRQVLQQVCRAARAGALPDAVPTA